MYEEKENLRSMIELLDENPVKAPGDEICRRSSKANTTPVCSLEV